MPSRGTRRRAPRDRIDLLEAESLQQADLNPRELEAVGALGIGVSPAASSPVPLSAETFPHFLAGADLDEPPA